MSARVLAFVTALLSSFAASGANFIVNNTNDSGAGSLRQAITDANNTVGADTISFAIPGSGVHTIAPASFLPTITEQVTIDGYTQAGSSANTAAFPAALNTVLRIEIASLQGHLVVNGANTIIRGLAMNGSVDNIDVNADNVTIAGNFLGTNVAGTAGAPAAGGGFGVRHNNGNNMTIGGPNAADRNLLSGNNQGGIIIGFIPVSSGHLIQGNFIGTDVTGTVSLNPITNPAGLSNINNAQVLNNLISGNSGGGLDTINVTPNSVVIRGNLIGTQANGTSPLPNGNFGGINVRVSNVAIGGAAAGQPNVIAHNTGAGIVVQLNANGDPIVRNSIYGNAFLGIALNASTIAVPLPNDAGDADTVPGNHGQNRPVLTSAPVASGNATISGTLNSLASTQFRIEFFANAACGLQGYGQGQTYIGESTITTDGSGNASFGPVVLAVPAGQSVITATATNIATADTSEFSQCLAAAGGTTTTVVSSLNPSTVGQTVTFTATVTGTSPTGNVQFFDGATSLGTVALAGGTAALTTSSLAAGTHPITAVYAGDADDAGSTSGVLSQVVNSPSAGATSTALVSSRNPSTVGQSVTFTATVTGSSPTGSIQFFDGGTSLGTVAMSGASASLTTSSLVVGTHQITATYSGDADDASSTSGVLSQVVNAAGAPPSSSDAQPIPVIPLPLLGLLVALLAGLGVRRLR